MTVFEKIEAQQKGRENTDVWMVGEQLKDICRNDPSCATIVAEDLENKAMSIEAAAKKIKEYADEQKRKQKGNCVCVPPNVAEGIIREFYGLPTAGNSAANGETPMLEPVQASDIAGGFLDLDSFL